MAATAPGIGNMFSINGPVMVTSACEHAPSAAGRLLRSGNGFSPNSGGSGVELVLV